MRRHDTSEDSSICLVLWWKLTPTKILEKKKKKKEDVFST